MDALPDPDLRPSIGDLFTQLVDDTTAFVRAEVALYRAQAGQKALSAGVVVALFGTAIMLVQGAVIALLVGLVIGLAPLVGIWWAIAIVVVATVIVAFILGQIGVSRVTQLINPDEDK